MPKPARCVICRELAIAGDRTCGAPACVERAEAFRQRAEAAARWKPRPAAAHEPTLPVLPMARRAKRPRARFAKAERRPRDTAPPAPFWELVDD
jgi:hypothetical protein